MNPFNLVVMLGIVISSYSYAGGTDVGGGGNVWVCFDTSKPEGVGIAKRVDANNGVVEGKDISLINKIIPLDLYFQTSTELFNASNRSLISLKPGEKPIEYIQRQVARYGSMFPALKEYFQDALSSLSQSEMKEAGNGIYRINDLFKNEDGIGQGSTLPVVLSTDECTWVTVIVQRGSPAQGHNTLYVDPRLFNHPLMTEFYRAVLLTHETALFIQRSYLEKNNKKMIGNLGTEVVRNFTYAFVSTGKTFGRFESLFFEMMGRRPTVRSPEYPDYFDWDLMAMPLVESLTNLGELHDFEYQKHRDKFKSELKRLSANLEQLDSNNATLRKNWKETFEKAAVNKNCRSQAKADMIRSALKNLSFLSDVNENLATQVKHALDLMNQSADRFLEMRDQYELTSNEMFYSNLPHFGFVYSHKGEYPSFSTYEERHQVAELSSAAISIRNCLDPEDASLLKETEMHFIEKVQDEWLAFRKVEFSQDPRALAQEWVTLKFNKYAALFDPKVAVSIQSQLVEELLMRKKLFLTGFSINSTMSRDSGYSYRDQVLLSDTIVALRNILLAQEIH